MPSPNAQLVVASGPMAGATFSIPATGSLTLGRSLECDLQLDEQGVSRRHCRVTARPQGLELLDLGSRNGTRVNGRLVDACMLYDGDTLAVGSTLFHVVLAQRERLSRTRSGISFIEDLGPSSNAQRRRYDPKAGVLSSGSLGELQLARASVMLDAVCVLANTVNSERRLDPILEAVVETILKVSDADRTALMLQSGPGSRPEPALMRARDNKVGEFRVSRTILQETLTHGVSLLISDARADERFSQRASVVLEPVHSVMCVPLKAEDRIIGAIYADSLRAVSAFGELELAVLAAVGHQAGTAIERARLISDLERLFVGTVRTLIASIEAKDSYTRGHSERVTSLAVMVADEMGLSEEDRDVVEIGGLLHDVGKIGVPEEVLRKPTDLDVAERQEIEKHATAGRRIVENMPEIGRIVNMAGIAAAVEHHHERFDGKGYPARLSGHQIPLAARILSVADTYDAITSDRPYRRGRQRSEAMDIIVTGTGTQFDPVVVEALERVQGRDGLAHLEPGAGRFRIGPAARATARTEPPFSQLKGR